MASVFYMGQIPKVAASTLMRIVGVSGKQYKKVMWHSTELIIKPLLSVDEYINVIQRIINDCSTPQGECVVELIDFSLRRNVVSAYAFVDYPDDIDDLYYILYASDLFETVRKHINDSQYDAITNTIYLLARFRERAGDISG